MPRHRLRTSSPDAAACPTHQQFFNRRNRDAYGPEIESGSPRWDEALAMDDIRNVINTIYAGSILDWESDLWPDLFPTYRPCSPPTDHCPSLIGDLNGDLCVDAADLGLLIGSWGGEAGDLNDDFSGGLIHNCLNGLRLNWLIRLRRHHRLDNLL